MAPVDTNPPIVLDTLKPGEPVDVRMSLMQEPVVWRSGYTFVAYDNDRHPGTVLVYNARHLHKTTRWDAAHVRRTPRP